MLAPVLLATLFATAPDAAAASQAWTLQVAPLPAGVTAGDLSTSSLSCAPTGGCALVISAAQTTNYQQAVVADVLHGSTFDTAQLPLPDGTSSGYEDQLGNVSCSASSDCVAVGYYGSTRTGALIETYDGTGWSAQDAPDGYPGVRFNDVACSTATCFADGIYSEYNGDRAYLAARDEGTWEHLLQGGVAAKSGSRYGALHQLFSAACAPAGPCYTLGYESDNASLTTPFLVYRSGNGYAASPLPVPDGISPTDLTMGGMSCAGPTDCAAIGTYVDASATHQYLLAEVLRTGVLETDPIPIPRALTTLDDPLEPRAIDCPSVNRCFGVVGFRYSSAVHGALIVRYDGTHWTSRFAPAPPTAVSTRAVDLNGVSCLSTSSCVVTGSYGRSVNGKTRLRPLVERWQSGTWTPQTLRLPAGIPARANVQLRDVSCGAGTCLADGSYPNRGVVVTIAAVATGLS